MLCISRNQNEVFLLLNEETGEPLAAVSLVDVQGNRCKFGINAPRHIKILRKEVYDRINGDKESATMTASQLNAFFNN